MRSVLRLLLYAGLLAAGYWCGFGAYRDYSLLMMDDGTDLAHATRIKPTKPKPSTDTAAEADGQAPRPGSSPTNATATKAVPPCEETDEAAAVHSGRRAGRNYLHLLGYTLGLAVSLLGLGLVAAQDFGHVLKFRFGKEVSYVDARSARNAGYERAELVALKGQPHEAIRMLQALLARHPNHLHSLLRIAELYDKELQDFPNAALHYEELLKHKLPAEQWGWIAIRLANIYSGKLNQPHTALELIRRLAAEFPETQAGGKALKRLALIDKAGVPAESQGEL